MFGCSWRPPRAGWWGYLEDPCPLRVQEGSGGLSGRYAGKRKERQRETGGETKVGEPPFANMLRVFFFSFWEGLERGKMDVQKTKGRE